MLSVIRTLIDLFDAAMGFDEDITIPSDCQYPISLVAVSII